jgi:aminoglycoside phosphotransferase (APT) family kinase protein
VWFHGDLHSGNLLSHRGQLTAVIDFGGCGIGDPAIDAIAAWWLFSDGSRGVFRQASQFDDDTWARGRGWALSVALIALPYYVDTNPIFADMSRRAIREVLGDRA